METFETHIENWYLQCMPGDGGRISVLQFAGRDLLTHSPAAFKPPGMDLGEYETRPVYGYDDCFPTVDLCRYPELNSRGRDHGELCWKRWQVKEEYNKLICSVDCPSPHATFTRTLEFSGNSLKWKFKIINLSASGFPFLHVMHALMPLQNLQYFELPGFRKILDENTAAELDLKYPYEVVEYLMHIKPGTFRMLVLKYPVNGRIKVGLKSGITINMDFNVDLFPTLGIWWNNSGYPDEDTLQRNEFAFEPIPGSCSNLDQSFRDGTYLYAEPGKSLDWEMIWNIEMK
jgi:hypothetical protein